MTSPDPSYRTIRVRHDDDICFLQLHRPEADNTINALLVQECTQVVEACERSAKVVVIEGSPEVFCFGADFREMATGGGVQDPAPLFDLWHKLATGSFVSVAHVQGKVNAGGIGFVAACDVALCQDKVPFSLSELLFGLMPACVLPFLIRRMGAARAHYMTVMTQPVSAQQALSWGLVDAVADNGDVLLRKHLSRLRRLSKAGVASYKAYMNTLSDFLAASRAAALKANNEVFSNPQNLQKITRYVNTGKLPWEED
jgi:polyketide biosynthesis enoyl-CoA hydratase PksH